MNTFGCYLSKHIDISLDFELFHIVNYFYFIYTGTARYFVNVLICPFIDLTLT